MKMNIRITEMKAVSILAALIGFSICGDVRAQTCTTNSPAPADLGDDFYEGKTNKIARVYAVTPRYVQVIYAGGLGGRKIPRQLLPSRLAALYPYDAAQAAAYEKHSMQIAALQAAAQQEILRETARKREQQITQEIARLTSAIRELEGDFRGEKERPGSARKRARLENMVSQWQQLRAQRARLDEDLAAIRARQVAGR